MWGYTPSIPEMYKSGDRSLANRPTQIVSVSRSYLVNRWNAVLCLQKALCSRPDRCHRHCFSRRLGEHFILVYYRSAWLDTGGPLPKIFFETLWHLSSVSYFVCWYHFFFSFFFSFFQRRPAYRRTLPPYWKRWGSRSARTDLPPKLHFSFGQAVRTSVCVCVCVCVSQRKKKVPDEWQALQATPAILQVSSSKHSAKKYI